MTGRWRNLGFGAVISSHLLALTSYSSAQGADETLLSFAVGLRLSSATQSWSGYGIYLRDGLFITAAHVVGRGWMTRPRVVFLGQEYSTRVVKEGSFEGTDLTLLSVDQHLLPMRLQLRRNTLCAAPPWPGEQVVTIIPGAVARSYIIAPERLPVTVRRFRTAIADVASTGNSGSGVFDARHGCLLGIMSRKISQSQTRPDSGKPETRDIAKYFVPAAEIIAFLPAEFRR